MASLFGAMSIAEIQAGLQAREFSVCEIARETIAYIKQEDSRIHAFIELTENLALKAAGRIDKALLRTSLSDMGSLAGVPVAFKDNMNLQGSHTTCASRVLEGYLASATASCVQNLLMADALPLGKLNLDEFAFGSSTETSAFAQTCNPWDLRRVPGGSSGGSAAAVAAGMVPLALGSDAGGSIRQPGAFCGVVAVKPSYGSVSLNGVVGFIEGLDQVGPLTRNVWDAVLALDVLRFGEPRNKSALSERVKNAVQLAEKIRGLRIGIAPEFMEAQGLALEIKTKVEEVARHFCSLGAQVKEITLPHIQEAMSAYYVLGPRQVYENFSDFNPAHYGLTKSLATGKISQEDFFDERCMDRLGSEAKRRIALGAQLVSSAERDNLYSAAKKSQTLIKQDYERAYEQVDCILAPVTPRTAFKFGEISDPTEMRLSDMFTVSVNIAGNGAMSMPVGLGNETGLPVGIQLICPAYQEEKMFIAAGALEQVYGCASLAPAFSE